MLIQAPAITLSGGFAPVSTTVLDAVTEIIRDLFDEYDGPVSSTLTAHDVAQWDSLGHVQLLVMIEQRFGIKFTTSEIEGLKNLGNLIALIETKRPK